MVTAAVSNYWVLIPAFLVITIFLALRWYYLKTSREVKRLEAIGMSHQTYSQLFSTSIIWVLTLYMQVWRRKVWSILAITRMMSMSTYG